GKRDAERREDRAARQREDREDQRGGGARPDRHAPPVLGRAGPQGHEEWSGFDGVDDREEGRERENHEFRVGRRKHARSLFEAVAAAARVLGSYSRRTNQRPTAA